MDNLTSNTRFSMQDAIRVENMSVERDGRFLLEQTSFRVPTGSFLAIIGPSGCGKSTLLKILAGLIKATDGLVELAGHPVSDLKKQYPLAVGYLPQSGIFHSELTVEEILQTAVSLRLPASVPTNVQENWVKHIIKLAGIERVRPQRYKTLSGGQMRRVALAEELIGDPTFLFLDELTSGLDEYSDREMMSWLRDLAHVYGKTVVLVTHATYHLDCADDVLFLYEGRVAHIASYERLLASHSVTTLSDLFELYLTSDPEAVQQKSAQAKREDVSETEQPLKTAQPPSGFAQFPALLKRQMRLFYRERAQLWLHVALALTFPLLVAVFAVEGLPQVRQLTMDLESNIVRSLVEQLAYLKESFRVASLVSGLAMFQVILLTLIGANNGAREISNENGILAKEIQSGLSPVAYLFTKFLQIGILSALQAFWMAYFVKGVCGFPGSFAAQFGILWATTLAMSTVCLAISAGCSSPERASLLSIYLVGFQLPLSGAALALPDWLASVCRPFVAAYWGWSGYLMTLQDTRSYDVVKQSTETLIAGYELSVAALLAHIVVAFFAAWFFIIRGKNSL